MHVSKDKFPTSTDGRQNNEMHTKKSNYDKAEYILKVRVHKTYDERGLLEVVHL